METKQPYNIYFEKSINSVIMDWNGYSTTAEFREGTETMLNLLIANKTSKVLADIKDMSIIGTEDQKWLETNFLPRAIRFGFRACAIIKSDSYFNNVAIDTISLKADKENLQINVFDNIEQAQAWLNSL